jgi:hypothetical protein
MSSETRKETHMKRYRVRVYTEVIYGTEIQKHAVVRGCESVYEDLNGFVANNVCRVLNAEYENMKRNALRDAVTALLDKLNAGE